MSDLRIKVKIDGEASSYSQTLYIKMVSMLSPYLDHFFWTVLKLQLTFKLSLHPVSYAFLNEGSW